LQGSTSRFQGIGHFASENLRQKAVNWTQLSDFATVGLELKGQ